MAGVMVTWPESLLLKVNSSHRSITDLDKPFERISSVMNKAKVITKERVEMLMVEQGLSIIENAFI